MDKITSDTLRRAGWQPGFRNTVDGLRNWWNKLNRFPRHKAAEDALAEFGGIEVNISGEGETIARQPFRLNPTLALGEEELFDIEGKRLGKRLFPLGDGEGGHYFLAIDEEGAVYALGQWYVDWVGEAIESAIENLVHGRRGKRLIED